MKSHFIKTSTALLTHVWKYVLIVVLTFTTSCATEEIEDTMTKADTVASALAEKSPRFDAVTAMSGRWFYIRNKESGKYLDIENYGRDGERNVHQWSYTGDKNQMWYVLKQPKGYLIYSYVHSEGNHYFLDIKDAEEGNGANCQITPYIGTDAEYHYYDITGSENSSYFRIKIIDSGKYLEVSNFSEDNGGNVQQWSENGEYSQIWEFFPVLDPSD